MRRRLLSALRLVCKCFIVGVAAAMTLLTLAQLGSQSDIWIELSRYLPFYWLALPCALGVGLACLLGWRWALASAIAPLVLATVTMGLEWGSGEPGDRRVRLMTYNAKLHGNNSTPANVSAIAAEVARHAPDILVMQDSDGLLVERGAPALSGGPPLFGLPNVYALGQYVVASRLPLRGCAPGQIDFGNEGHRYLRCSFDAHGVELTVVTAHFQSPRMGLVAARREGVDGVGTWQQNFDQRMTQARSLARQISSMPRPLVVAGDFNAPDSSPVIQRLLAAGLRDSFSVAGRGYGFSYGESLRAGLAFLRIDHILASPDLGIAASFVGDRGPSEHRPVIADLVLRP